MKLRNKKTGEILKTFVINSGDQIRQYDSLAELNEDWEDAPEEPKEYWYIGSSGLVHKEQTNLHSEAREAIGNRFGSPEEAEKAVEKFKAWKRLKDKGFRLNHWKEAQLRPNMSCVAITGNIKVDEETRADLDLLFGGEE